MRPWRKRSRSSKKGFHDITTNTNRRWQFVSHSNSYYDYTHAYQSPHPAAMPSTAHSSYALDSSFVDDGMGRLSSEMSQYFPSGSNFNNVRHVEFRRENDERLEQQTHTHHRLYDYQEPKHAAGHGSSYSLATHGYSRNQEEEDDRWYGTGFSEDRRDQGKGGRSDGDFPSSSWQETGPRKEISSTDECQKGKGKGPNRLPKHNCPPSGSTEGQFDNQRDYTETPTDAKKQSPSTKISRSAFVADLRQRILASKNAPRRRRGYDPSSSAVPVPKDQQDSTDESGRPLSRMGLKVVALDCEMVGCVEVRVSQRTNLNPATSTDQVLHRTKLNPISHKKKKQVPTVREISVAGRCSVVDYKGGILFDSFIMPHLQILNLRTRFSGIRKRDLESAPNFHDAKADILRVLDGRIVVGHAIQNDLSSLEMTLPSDKIRDTSLYKPLRKMARLNVAHPPSLKNLARVLLGRTIQKRAHCSVEDARATMDVYKKVEIPWESSLF